MPVVSGRKLKQPRKTLAQGRCLVIQAVVLLYLLLLGMRKIRNFTSVHLVQQLCIKLCIVERRVTVYDVLHLLTVKTAAARRVGQEVEPVAGTYKRGHTRHFAKSGSIGAARLHGAKLHQILKFGIVQLVVAVKLVKIDKRKARQRQFKTLVAGQLKLVGVVIAQFGR